MIPSPCFAKISAIALPMPRLAPVSNTFFDLSSCSAMIGTSTTPPLSVVSELTDLFFYPNELYRKIVHMHKIADDELEEHPK